MNTFNSNIETSTSYGSDHNERKHKSKSFFTKWPFIVLCLLIVLGAVGYYFYSSRMGKTEGPTLSEKEVSKLVGKVGSMMELPDETPTGVVITDKSKLNATNLFNEAEDGDILLLFTAKNKAVIYRPSNGKIVSMANLNANTPSTTTPATSNGLEFNSGARSTVPNVAE